jgi:hypothetical protein
MFSGYFSGDALRSYQQSPHKCRMVCIAQCLVERRYVKFVIIDRLHEWLRFTAFFEERGLPRPLSVQCWRFNSTLHSASWSASLGSIMLLMRAAAMPLAAFVLIKNCLCSTQNRIGVWVFYRRVQDGSRFMNGRRHDSSLMQIGENPACLYRCFDQLILIRVQKMGDEAGVLIHDVS